MSDTTLSAVEARLERHGVRLPPAPEPAANYVEVVVTGNLAFVSGHLGRNADGGRAAGRLGADLSVEQGYEAARHAALAAVASLKESLGNLDRVVRIVRLLCVVNSTPEFAEQHKVANGASDLFVQAFGESGRHARAAIGVAALPFGACCEIVLVVEVA